MYNFEYEEFLAERFPICQAALEFPRDSKCLLVLGKQRAIRFLEMNCSTVYGFHGEARHSRDMNQLTVGLMPTLFDSSLSLDLLRNEDVDPAVTDTLQRLVKKGQRSSGLWNYFLNVPDKIRNYFPDDIDDTGCSAGVLHLLGKLDREECTAVANVMLDTALVGPNGGLGSWIPVAKINKDRKVIMDKRLLERAREDIGSIANSLWFLSLIDMDTDERAKSSVSCVNKFLDEHLVDVNAVLKHFMIYYTDRYVIYFFIARFMDKSTYAQKLFGSKFATLVRNSLLEMSTENAKVLQMASCILAATRLGLHKLDGQKLISMDKADVDQVRDKIMVLTKLILSQQYDDGSFPVWKLFRWDHTGYYAGSKIDSTTFALKALSTVQEQVMDRGQSITTEELAVY